MQAVLSIDSLSSFCKKKIELKLIFKYILLLFVITITSETIVYGQGETTEELRKEADEYFKNEEYAEAGLIYGRLISDGERSKDHDLNYRYGTCLVHGSGDEKLKSIAFLKKSVRNPSIDKRAYYFLGKAYQLNFQFDQALKQYQKFLNH